MTRKKANAQIETHEPRAERQRLGFVWDKEKEPEKVVLDCQEKFPVLKEVKSKAIVKDEKSPTNIIIEGDNYHALSVLNYTHQGRIDVIYIDPPYNTGKKDWKYNNKYVDNNDSYIHGKWLSFMDKRLRLAKNLLSDKGILICAIDYREKCRLGLLLEDIFSEKEITFVTIVHNPRGKQGIGFSYTHEYACFVYPKESGVIQEKDKEPDESNFRNWGGESLRTDAKNCFYPIIVHEEQGKLKIIETQESCSENFSPQAQTIKIGKGLFEVYPIDLNGVERKWRYSDTGIKDILKSLIAVRKKDRIEIKIIKKSERYKTVWQDKKYDANIYGTRLLYDIIKKNFPFPKSLYLVKECLEAVCKNNPNAIILDFFAGSGTTGHAVLELNNEDDGNRQLEMLHSL